MGGWLERRLFEYLPLNITNILRTWQDRKDVAYILSRHLGTRQDFDFVL